MMLLHFQIQRHIIDRGNSHFCHKHDLFLHVKSGLVFCLMSRSTIFQSFWDGATASWVFTSTLGTLKCLAQGHYREVVGFEPCTSRSVARSSTTKPPLPPIRVK